MTEFLTRTEVRSEVSAGITKHELSAAKNLADRKKQEKQERHDFATKLDKMFSSTNDRVDDKLSTTAFRVYVSTFIVLLGAIISVIYWSQIGNKEDIIEIKINQAQLSEKVNHLSEDVNQLSEVLNLIYEKIVKGE